MIIGVLRVSLLIPGCNSLKEKRRVLKPLKSRLGSNFNVSVAEVGQQDKWQLATLAIVHVGLKRPVVDSVMSNSVNMIEAYHELQVINYETELIT